MNKLFIAGIGIKFLSHMTLEVHSVIKKCDCVIYLVNEPAVKRWIDENSKEAISLDEIYFSFQERTEAYQAISQKVMEVATRYQSTCFIIYGHPLILSNSAEQLIKEIKEELLNIEIEILPGISSIDTLLCDLCIDPGRGGLQAFEATEFINTNYTINTNSHLILWQIGVVGVQSIIQNDKDLVGCIERKIAISQLQRKLLDWYTETHPIVLYVASIYPQVPCERLDIYLSDLDNVNIPRLATAYIKPNLIF